MGIQEQNMKNMLHLFSASLFIFSAYLWAGEYTPAAEKLFLSAYRSETVNAVVDAIDQRTREVVLTDSDGDTHMFPAGPDVRNLDQVEVGDHVTAAYHEEINVSLRDTKGAEPGSAYAEEVAGAPAGSKPEGKIVTKTVINAIVVAIDLEDNTFKLRFPDEVVEEFTAENPENLSKAAIGDLVVITVNQSLDILVEQPAGN
jgi:hypothetical protein